MGLKATELWVSNITLETSSESGSRIGWARNSRRGRSARAIFAAMRSLSFFAAMPASKSPDLGSLALAKSALRSAKLYCSPRIT